MSEKVELMQYLSELTPEKTELLLMRLPALLSEFEAQGLPVHLLRQKQIQ